MNQATVKLEAPDGASGVSFEGEDYRVDGGLVEVPARAEPMLRAHGYVPYVPKPKQKLEKAKSDGVF